jgi:hypothetical protein
MGRKVRVAMNAGHDVFGDLVNVECARVVDLHRRAEPDIDLVVMHAIAITGSSILMGQLQFRPHGACRCMGRPLAFRSLKVATLSD